MESLWLKVVSQWVCLILQVCAFVETRVFVACGTIKESDGMDPWGFRE